MGMILELVPNQGLKGASGTTSAHGNKQATAAKKTPSHPLQDFSLRWYNYPLNTQCFAVIVDDPSQVRDPVYYLSYDIPVGSEVIEHFESLGNLVEFNSPNPLRIRVYALKARTNLPPNATQVQLRRAMEGITVAVGQQWLGRNIH